MEEDLAVANWDTAQLRHLLLWSWRVIWVAAVRGRLQQPIAPLLAERYTYQTGRRLDSEQFQEMTRMLRGLNAIERHGDAWAVVAPPHEAKFSHMVLRLWIGAGRRVEGGKNALTETFARTFGLSMTSASKAIQAAIDSGELMPSYQDSWLVALISGDSGPKDAPPPLYAELEDLDKAVARLFMAGLDGFGPDSTRFDVLVDNGFTLELATAVVDCLVAIRRLEPHTGATGEPDHIHGGIMLLDRSRIKPAEYAELEAAWARAKSDQG